MLVSQRLSLSPSPWPLGSWPGRGRQVGHCSKPQAPWRLCRWPHQGMLTPGQLGPWPAGRVSEPLLLSSVRAVTRSAYLGVEVGKRGSVGTGPGFQQVWAEPAGGGLGVTTRVCVCR